MDDTFFNGWSTVCRTIQDAIVSNNLTVVIVIPFTSSRVCVTRVRIAKGFRRSSIFHSKSLSSLWQCIGVLIFTRSTLVRRCPCGHISRVWERACGVVSKVLSLPLYLFPEVTGGGQARSSGEQLHCQWPEAHRHTVTAAVTAYVTATVCAQVPVRYFTHVQVTVTVFSVPGTAVSVTVSPPAGDVA